MNIMARLHKLIKGYNYKCKRCGMEVHLNDGGVDFCAICNLVTKVEKLDEIRKLADINGFTTTVTFSSLREILLSGLEEKCEPVFNQEEYLGSHGYFKKQDTITIDRGIAEQWMAAWDNSRLRSEDMPFGNLNTELRRSLNAHEKKA